MRWIVLFVLVLSACSSDEEELRNGVVKLQFQRGANEADQPPFQGQSMVVVAMAYGECLVDYYAQHSDERQDGVDGEADFGSLDLGGEGWKDRLCDADTGFFVDCEVLSLEQELEEIVPNLTVTYSVGGVDLEGRQMLVGPFPTPESAQCQNGEAAIVQVLDVSGLDEDGNVVWTMESFNPPDAVVDQGGAIGISF